MLVSTSLVFMTYYRKILQIALPTMVENGLQMLMTVADAYLVAQLGLVAVSAVSLAGNVIAVYQALFIALASAISAQVAKNLTKGKGFLLAKTRSALALTVWLSVVLGLLSVFGGNVLLASMGASDRVNRLGSLYLSWVGGGIILLGLMTSLGAVLRASGKPRQPMYVSLLVNLVNILLSALFIFVCHWGVLGAALGTVLARLLGLTLLYHQLGFRANIWSWRIDKELLGLALPSASERLAMRLGDLLVVSMVAALGTPILAGNAIGETLIQFNYLPAISITSATVILTAQASGHNDSLEISRISSHSYHLSLLSMGVIAISLLLANPILIPWFTKDLVAGQAANQLILMSFISLPMTAGTLIYTGLWQGLGQPKLPFYATTFGMLVIRIGLGYIMAFTLDLGFVGLLLAVSLDNLFRWLFLKIIYHSGRKSTDENK